MIKHEQKFLEKWVREHIKNDNIMRYLKGAILEGKSTRGGPTFNIKEFKDHQRKAAVQVISADKKPLLYKIPDDGVSKKPGDYMCPSDYLVIIEFRSGWVLMGAERLLEWEKKHGSRIGITDAKRISIACG
jgi:hypothetical protein